jgi:hypothetical protein
VVGATLTTCRVSHLRQQFACVATNLQKIAGTGQQHHRAVGYVQRSDKLRHGGPRLTGFVNHSPSSARASTAAC